MYRGWSWTDSWIPGVLVAICAAAASAPAGTTVLTTDTLIDWNNITYEGEDIVVRGCTVTINGYHQFNSLTIERDATNEPGIVTHAAGFSRNGINGMWLEIAQNVSIQGGQLPFVASAISVDGRGFAGSAGPGAGQNASFVGASGAAHGGGAGRGNGGTTPGRPYGQATLSQPASHGSGGGSSQSAGGEGGGCIRLVVGGTLTVNGSISANGANGRNGGGDDDSGAGSGGSLWIVCGGLEGTGSISADGGDGGGNYDQPNEVFGGGGGGGRIAIQAATTSAFAGSTRCRGGRGWEPGGAGTQFWTIQGEQPRLMVDNAGRSPAGVTEFEDQVQISADLYVRGAAIVGPRRGVPGLHLVVNGDAFVEPDGAIAGDARGFGGSSGPGAGQNASFVGASGAAYGGGGGQGNGSTAPGQTYGQESLAQPLNLGSGGGGSESSGGAGGGALRLTVSGALSALGRISVNGGSGRDGGSDDDSGGGSGGSLWIACDALAGNGTISSDGGDGGGNYDQQAVSGGGGGGGRIALYVADDSGFSGTLRARGGRGWEPGGAGTVYLRRGTAQPILYIDNADRSPAGTTEFAGEFSIEADVVVRNAGILGPRRSTTGLYFIALGDLTVEPDGAVSADRRGFPSATGPGAGPNGPFVGAGGAGYGGRGGRGNGNANGGAIYGESEFDMPVQLGSGGGASGDGGGAGGGAIRLRTIGALTVDGRISADGGPGRDGGGDDDSGGGSGGSLWIVCESLSGFGTISADGGDGGGNYNQPNSVFGGGGGGGRVAIYSGDCIGVPLANITADGGRGWEPGQDGTIHLVRTNPACPGGTADANCDGSINFFDIDPIVLALFDTPAYAAMYCGGCTCTVDTNCDGSVNFFDIDPFLECLFGNCTPCP